MFKSRKTIKFMTNWSLFVLFTTYALIKYTCLKSINDYLNSYEY